MIVGSTGTRMRGLGCAGTAGVARNWPGAKAVGPIADPEKNSAFPGNKGELA
jgi:hypothetical protein